MTLTFYKGSVNATNNPNWRSGALVSGTTSHAMTSGMVMCGTMPAAHTWAADYLYSAAYLVYKATVVLSSVSAKSGGKRTATTSEPHSLSVGDIVTVTSTGLTTETGATVSTVPSATTFTYVSTVTPDATTGGTGTVGFTTARKYNNITISIARTGSPKSSLSIGLATTPQANTMTLTTPYNGGTAPTLYSGQSFGSKITVPNAALSSSELNSGEYIAFWIRRISNTYTGFTSQTNTDTTFSLSYTADWAN